VKKSKDGEKKESRTGNQKSPRSIYPPQRRVILIGVGKKKTLKNRTRRATGNLRCRGGPHKKPRLPPDRFKARNLQEVWLMEEGKCWKRREAGERGTSNESKRSRHRRRAELTSSGGSLPSAGKERKVLILYERRIDPVIHFLIVSAGAETLTKGGVYNIFLSTKKQRVLKTGEEKGPSGRMTTHRVIVLGGKRP